VPSVRQDKGVTIDHSEVTVSGDMAGGNQTSAQGDVVGGNKTFAGGDIVGRDKIGNITGDGNVVFTGGLTVMQGASPDQPLDMPESEYDLQAVRELLGAAFSDEDINTLAFDRFRAVYEDLGGGMSKGNKIRRLVDWCVHNGQIKALLAEVKQRNPAQYSKYEHRLKRQS
jgi:hypothetical protein